jgi:hypothetical protein
MYAQVELQEEEEYRKELLSKLRKQQPPGCQHSVRVMAHTGEQA